MILLNLVQSIRAAVRKMLSDHRDSKLIADMMEGVSEFPELYKITLTNQLDWVRQSNLPPNTQHVVLRLAKVIVDRILLIRAVVGIQPMQAPVDVGFMIRYVNDSIDTPHLTLEVKKFTREACTYKLKTEMPVEVQQDVMKAYNIDLESEIISALGNEVSTDIITPILFTLVKKAGTTATHDTHDPYQILIRIDSLATDIARKTRRGVGRVIVTSPEGAAILLQLTGPIRFEPYQPKSNVMTLACIQLAGQLVTRDSVLYTVYVTTGLPSSEPDTISFLVAYKGASEVDAGFIYSPYTMVTPTGILIDPSTFQLRVGTATRYCLRGDDDSMNYYAVLNVTETK